MKQTIIVISIALLLGCSKKDNPVSSDGPNIKMSVVFFDTLTVSQGKMLRWKVYNLGPDTAFNVNIKVLSTDSIPADASVWAGMGHVYVPFYGLPTSPNYSYSFHIADKLNPTQDPNNGWQILTRLTYDYKIEPVYSH